VKKNIDFDTNSKKAPKKTLFEEKFKKKTRFSSKNNKTRKKKLGFWSGHFISVGD